MKSNFIKTVALAVFLAFFSQKGTAQFEVIRNYVFTADSVMGFDEQAASAAAFANACYGVEYKVFMYREKRTFIKQKYNLPTVVAPATTLYQNALASAMVSFTGGACNNEDFELASGGSAIVAPAAVQGWSLQSGTNANGCQQPGSLTNGSLYTVYTGPVTDNKVATPISSYFDSGSNTTPAGNCFIRLNDATGGQSLTRMSKSFVPTPTSALFQYAYIAVIEDGCHSCCDQAGFDIKVAVTNTSNNTTTVLACPNISVAVPGGSNCGSFGCSFSVAPGGPVFVPSPSPFTSWRYCDWTESAIDLTNYIGSLVTISVTVRDCDQGGHTGYVYFDAKCSPMTIYGNLNPFPAGSQNVTLPTCGPNGATMCATPGLGPFKWDGPGTAGTSYTAFSMSNACFITSISATYTLYMNPPGSCSPITRVITTTITPAPLLVISAVQAVCGGTLATISVTPSGSASNPTLLTWSPTYLTGSGPNPTLVTTANYAIPPGPPGSPPIIVTVTAKDPLGCAVTATAPVNPAAPDPTVTVNNLTGSYALTCLTPSIDLDVITTYTYGTLDFIWQSPSFSYSTSNISINTTYTAPYTVTLTATDPVTLCFDKRVISISTNTVRPVSTISPSFQPLNCGQTAQVVTITATSPTSNVSHTIFDPFGGSYSTTATQAIYPPGPGTYTHVLLDGVNGCSTTTQFTVSASVGFPSFSVTSSPLNYTLGCTTKSVITINVTDGQTDPPGGAVSYTLLAPGAANPSTTGALGTASSFTGINVPGTYTVITRANVGFCETRVPISVTSNTFGPTIDTVFVPNRVLDCYIPSTQLRGLSTTENISYNWALPGSVNQAGDTLSVVADFSKPTTTVVAIYTLTIKNNNSTCISTTLVPVYQNLFKPKAVISGTIALTCNTPTVMLSNQSVSNIPPNTIFPTGKQVVGLLWEGPSPQDPVSNQSTYLGFMTGTYTMTAQDLGNGCTSVTTAIVPDNRVYPILNNPVAAPDGTLECGSTASISPIISSDRTGLAFAWTSPPTATVSGQKTATLATNTVGEYQIMVTNTVNGCESSTKMDVVQGKLIADVLVAQESDYAPTEVTFTNKSHTTTNDTTKLKSVWVFSNGTTSTSTTAKATFNQPGTYTITLFASKGDCIEQIQKTINVDVPSSLVVPNVFTPNGDGVNDIFFLKTSNLTELSALIYDRWGHQVYELNNSTTGNISWDGKNQLGKEVAEGTYYYIIKAQGKDGVPYEKKGTISLYK
jgi:gliding motility-associated-like protein